MPGMDAIIALTEAELAEFFPGGMRDELNRLLPKSRHVEMPPGDPGDWAKLWRQSPASLLVTGWQTPSLNSAVAVEDLRSLRYVCHVAGSVRQLVPRKLIADGLLVTNWGATIGPSLAECALMLILMALRRASHWAVAMHRDGGWKTDASPIQSLLGRRIGLHGFGASAQSLVPMLRPFTDHIRVFAPGVPVDVFVRSGVKPAKSLVELFSTSDVVVELSGATPENRHVINEELLRAIPDGGVFVNIARGSLVDETALVRVAQEGRLQIALDVFDVEPLPVNSPLRGLSNVTLLPHLAGPARELRRDCGALALRNIRAFQRGEPLEAVVSLEVYDRST